MSESNRTWRAIGVAAALGVIAGAASLATAQQFDPWQDSPLMKSMSNYWAPNNQPTLGQLGNNEAVVVDLKGFKIAKAGAKGDTSSHIDKLHAREVSAGAIIFRSGDKLYIVDGKEVANK
jgi:hypothetical protein